MITVLDASTNVPLIFAANDPLYVTMLDKRAIFSVLALPRSRRFEVSFASNTFHSWSGEPISAQHWNFSTAGTDMSSLNFELVR